MFTFLLVVQAVIAGLLVTLILMQRSEGGGLGVGGSSSGLMTARGQSDFLTRATAIVAVAFVGLSIALAGIATTRQASTTIDTSLNQPLATTTPAVPGGDEVPATDPAGTDIMSAIAGQAESSGTESDEEAGE